MADVFSKAKRSLVMASIRDRGTKPELIVRKFVRYIGYSFRSNVGSLPGRPDIVIPKIRTVLQVRGCFWHGHKCLGGRVPETHRDYWKKKIQLNKDRDIRNDRRLRRAGWHVKTIWECRIRTANVLELHQLLIRLVGIQDRGVKLTPRQAALIDRSIAAMRDR